MKAKEMLDKTLEDFFPQEGVWYSYCFSKSKALEELYLPCHIRDNDWLADLIIKKYNLDLSIKETVLNYIVTSERFNKARYEYEQRIVSWQIDWMKNDGSGWIVDNKYGEFITFSPDYDKGFRKGIVDTLLAIGMNKEAVEEGIEKNANKWREKCMRIAYRNLYSVSPFTFHGNNLSDKEHYEKWLKLRLYEYYIEHKDEIDKYGEVLPEMKMTELEVNELKKWLEVEHEKRMIQISESKNEVRSSNTSEIKVSDCGNLEKVNKIPRLDFKTRLYLYITNAIMVKHTPVVDVPQKRRMYVSYSPKNEVYIFKDHDEYKRFFLMYLDDVLDDVIDLAIYAKDSKGQIVALKALCKFIIVKKKVNDFYNSITQEQIDEIHSKRKLTPLEVVQLWESHNLCIEGSKAIFPKNRCEFFNHNCHECLLESASHKLEYDNIDFETVNSKTYEQGSILKKEKIENKH